MNIRNWHTREVEVKISIIVSDLTILIFLSVELEFIDRFKVNTTKRKTTDLGDVAIWRV